MDKIFVERLSHLLYICNFLERSKTGLYESSEQQGSQCFVLATRLLFVIHSFIHSFSIDPSLSVLRRIDSNMSVLISPPFFFFLISILQVPVYVCKIYV